MKKQYDELDLPKNFKVKLMLFNNEPTFSVGVIELLNIIARTGSLNKACKEMNMAYSKGLRIIRRAEADLNYPLIEGKIGGVGGGGSVLTKKGEAFLNFYNDMTVEIDKFADQLLSDFING